jgi:hypothetical protein
VSEGTWFDDINDITGLNVEQWLKDGLRAVTEQEIARADARQKRRTEREETMSEDTDRDTEPFRSPTVSFEVYADTADEAELLALSMAREPFGPYRLLYVVRNYHLYPINNTSSKEAQKTGKKFRSTITIRAEEPPDSSGQ